jgi:hypothetical protein
MKARPKKIPGTVFLLLAGTSAALGQAAEPKRQSFEEYIRATIPAREEIDVFLNEMSWA